MSENPVPTRAASRRWLLAVLAALVLLTGACDVPPADSGDAAAPAGDEQQEDAGDRQRPFLVDGVADLVQEVEPSVVSVLFGQGLGQGGGSGVIYDAEGLIVTNAHVALAGEQLIVAFADGSQEPAELVAADERTDVAVLRVDVEEDLPPAVFSDELPRVGASAVAIGSPLGLENSVTAGVISGLDRSIPGAAQAGIPALTGLLQTDAALSPGSSGGALVNGHGEVVGISVAFIPPQMQAVSIGFAIPTGTVVDVVEQLLEDGEVAHAFLGVQLGPLTPQTRQELDVDADQGVIVIAVQDGGPAEEAGIAAGDVIVRLGDDDVREPGDVLTALRARSPGDVVEVEIARDAERRTVEVTLGERPAEDLDVQPPPEPGAPGPGPAPPAPEEPGGEVPGPAPGGGLLPPPGSGDGEALS